jgi:CubicO group peptidase (beta-lactamase class C family)
VSQAHLHIQAALQSVVDDGLAPGVAVAVVGADSADIFVAGTLSADAREGGPFAVTADSVYDLASLTKLLCTTVLVADAVDDDVIALDEHAFPAWPRATVARVLTHTAGLPAHHPFFAWLIGDPDRSWTVGQPAGRDAIVDAASRVSADENGAAVVYSDVGFIALGALIEARRQRSLDQLFSQHPLVQGTGLRFVDLSRDGYHPRAPLVAPTEHCAWRKRIVQGQVHDDNAYAMGGVAGHAGLFGSLNDMVVVAQRLLNRLLTPNDTLAAFARYRTEADPKRAMGFDTATPGGSTGDVFSEQTVGHLGFTGTSLWLDLERAVGVIILGNSVHLGRDSTKNRSRTSRVRLHRALSPILEGRG